MYKVWFKKEDKPEDSMIFDTPEECFEFCDFMESIGYTEFEIRRWDVE